MLWKNEQYNEGGQCIWSSVEGSHEVYVNPVNQSFAIMYKAPYQDPQPIKRVDEFGEAMKVVNNFMMNQYKKKAFAS